MGTNKCYRPNNPQQQHYGSCRSPLYCLHTVNQLSCSSSQEILCAGSNISGATLPHVPSSSTSQTQGDAPGSFTPTLAAHFDETLIRHIQGWPSENTEKQVLPATEIVLTTGLYICSVIMELQKPRLSVVSAVFEIIV